MKNLLIIYSNTPQYILINNKKQLEKIARKILQERIREGWSEVQDNLIYAESALRLNKCWQYLQQNFPANDRYEYLIGTGAVEIFRLKETY